MKRLLLIPLVGAALASCTSPPLLQPRVVRTTAEGALLFDLFSLPDDGRAAPATFPRK